VTHPDTIDLFLQAARAYADKAAIGGVGGDVSYASLERLARQYAAAFAGATEPRVFIALPRGKHAYAAMLGAALSGGFYAPANDASPADKLQRVARELDPDFVVAPAGLAPVLQAAAPRAQKIDPAEIERVCPMAGEGKRHRIAYIIFTSGSTGVPKGVVVPRTALDHYVAWIHESGCVRADDIVSQYNNLAFDVSVFDIFGALGCGATLVPIDGRFDRLMPARAIARERITVWTSVPTVVDLMMTGQQLTQANLRTVRLFTLAGEPLLRPHLEALFAACPDAVVQNAYGPTEATVTVSSMMMTADNFTEACEKAAVSIGPEIPGMRLHLAGGPHPDAGELVIVGPQLAEGYWKDPERSAAAFRPIEIGGQIYRGYFTGDWVERLRGLIFFRERIDHQVKIRGYRIELDEVAAAIRQCGWPSACVFKLGEGLAALVECPPDRQFDAEALREALGQRIEAYAIPDRMLATERMPRNENDKIDRAAARALLARLGDSHLVSGAP
jgi:D-alanine--poly(phosphoribitol) ligase subunit 1